MGSVLSGLSPRTAKAKVVTLVAVAVLVLISWVGVLDKQSTSYIDKSLVQATLAFAGARGLNAGISTLQSTTLSLGVGAGVEIGVGEVLDPFNDLVEQYSSAMKLSIASLVIQKVLLEIVSDTFFKVLITLSGALLLVSTFLSSERYTNALLKSFVFLVFLRFSLVFVVILNGAVDAAFIQEKTESNMQEIKALSEDVEKVQEQAELNDEEKAALEERGIALDKQREGLEEQLISLREKQERLTEELAGADDAVSAMEQGMTTIQKLNYLGRDEEYQQAIDQRDQLADELKGVLDDAEAVEEAIRDVDEDKVLVEKALAGEPTSMMDSIGRGMSDFAGHISSLGGDLGDGIQQRMENAVGTVLNVMTLFILKTLILPLLFLYMLNKATKLLWNVDVAALVAREKTRESEEGVSNG